MDFVRNVPPEFRSGDGPGDEALSEETLVENQLQLNEDKYCKENQVSVVICSWNINQRKPEAVDSIAKWMGLGAAPAAAKHVDPTVNSTSLSSDPPVTDISTSPVSPPADASPSLHAADAAAAASGLGSGSSSTTPGVIAVGLQEVDMSANALLREETEQSKPWVDAICKAAAGYKNVAARQLAGLLVVVLVRDDLASQVTDYSTAIVRCGAMGNSIANKGATGVRFSFNKTTFCFATAHFAAHQAEVDKRNRDFVRVCESMQFPGSEPMLLHDRVFFFGDLNYRLDLPYDEVCELVRQKKYTKLLESDQLAQQEHLYCTQYNFRFATPAFPPTYKYDPGTWDYDTSEKRRVPSWTDRVMWRSKAGVELKSFTQAENMLSSDHRAVAATFDVKVSREVPEIKQRLREDIVQRIRHIGRDKYAVPNMSLSCSEANFGNVLYGTCYSRDVTIANNGHGVILINIFSHCSGKKRGGARHTSSSWLSLSALKLRIDPGCSETLCIKCCVTKPVIQGLVGFPGPFENDGTGGEVELSQCLVFSAGQQRLWFTTEARYTPSCFGSSLAHLSQLGLVPIVEAYQSGRDKQPPPPDKPQVPKELWWLVDYLVRQGKRTPQLFQTDLSEESFAAVRNHLDRKCEALKDDPMVDACAVSQVLLVFLRDLQEPLMPSKHYDRLFGGNDEKFVFIAPRDLGLPPSHFNPLTYIVAFLKYLLRPENREHNLLTPELLAQGFAPALFQPTMFHAPSPEQEDIERVKKTEYLLRLLKD